MIKEYIVKKALDASLDVAKKALRESGSKLLISRDDIENSIDIHLKSVKNWSGEVSFSDLKKAKRTSDIFIELDLFVYPRHIRISPYEEIQSIPLLQIFEDSNEHFILLGHPGAGKTTSMKYLCQSLFYNEEFQSDRFSFPILIKLRDLNDSKTPASSIIIDTLYNILGLRIHFPEDLQKGDASSERKAVKEKLVVSVVESLGVLLILDGFDELAQAKKRSETIKGIRYLASHLDSSTMIVTSRTGDFKYSVEGTIQYEISPLNREQISTFALKWLNNQDKASDFISKIYDSPFADTAIRPLTLAHLCAIYERIGKIPDKPKTIYRKIINLLLEEWDQQRSVKRESTYAHFEVDRKFEFLCQLAYVLTTSHQRTVFSERDLLMVYQDICEDYDLEADEAQQVVNELESHTGLFLQSGYEQFEFAHKSLQEFLTAEYLVKLPSIPSDRGILNKLPNELAIAVTVSSSPSDYFSELVIHRLMKQELTEEFVRSFLSRLFLEKPDFNTNSKLGLALVFLYTVYVECNVVRGDQLKLFYFDAIVSEFEKIMKLVLRRSSIDLIQSYYKSNHTYRTGDGDTLHRMHRGSNAKDHGLPIQYSELPKTIYIKESLLNKATNSGQQSEDISEIPF